MSARGVPARAVILATVGVFVVGLGDLGVSTVGSGVLARARQDPAAGGRQQVFRAAANGISVDVAVRDGNRPVAGLTKDDFVVYDNGVRQVVDSVSLGEVPVDVTFFLGTSNQTRAGEIRDLGADVAAIVRSLRPRDRVRLLTLENQVADVFDWRDGGDAMGRIDVRPGGIQSLYDACLVALLHRPDPDRRHLIVAITDGVEFGSVVDSTTVRDVARRAEGLLHLVVVDPVGAPPAANNVTSPSPVVMGGRGTLRTSTLAAPGAATGFSFLRATWLHVLADERGIDRLAEAATLTGGTSRHVEAGTSIVETFQRAFDDFRQSYLLRYTAEGVPPGGWHELRVEIAGGRGYDVRARRGYFGG
ncbi:MAG: VWA domain-containing protein [Vicinamibacterales bacterium]